MRKSASGGRTVDPLSKSNASGTVEVRRFRTFGACREADIKQGIKREAATDFTTAAMCFAWPGYLDRKPFHGRERISQFLELNVA